MNTAQEKSIGDEEDKTNGLYKEREISDLLKKGS
jgi:hypothetical protein